MIQFFRIKMILVFFMLGVVAFAQTLEKDLGTQIDAIVDASGNGDFTTVAAAIAAAPNNATTEHLIFVRNGIYTEKIEIPSAKTHLTLVGEHMDKTIIQYGDHNGSGKLYDGILTSSIGTAIGTFTSHTLLAQPDDFILANMTIKNSAGPVGQAVALNLGGDRNYVYRCRVLGHQDTFFSGNIGRMFFKETYVEGNVDFIFGGGVVWFQDCLIVSNRGSSQITAASTGASLSYGYVFNECQILGLDGITGIGLGRPWKDYCKTVFMNSYMGKQMGPDGWSPWNVSSDKVFYAVYNNSGPGSGFTNYPDWAFKLTEAQALEYTIEKAFAKSVKTSPYANDWLPATDAGVFSVVASHSVDPIADSLYYLAKLDKVYYDGNELTDFDPKTAIYPLTITTPVFVDSLLSVTTLDPAATVAVLPPKKLPGYVFVEIKSRNGSGKYKFLIYLTYQPLALFDEDSDIVVSPNPIGADQLLHFDLIKDWKNPIRLRVYDMSGKLVTDHIFNGKLEASKYSLDTSAWVGKGIFNYIIESENEVLKTGKLIKN
jgi:pectinesterase